MASVEGISEDKLREMKAHYEATKLHTKAYQIESLLQSREAAKISIAVIGPSGSGKSTLVHALRGHKGGDDDDEFYNPKTTSEAVSYPYSEYPNTLIWDLPGLQAKDQPEQYLKNVTVEKYNIVLIAASQQITDHLLKLISAVKQKGKTFYIIRTKVDVDVHTAKRRQRPRFNLKNTLQAIRAESTEVLEKAKLNGAPMFLVSSFELQKFDFLWLQDSLEKDIMGHERNLTNDSDELKQISEEDIQDFYLAYETDGFSNVLAKIKSSLAVPGSLKLEIAVIGEVGSGKSTFLNALRGLKCDDDDGAAETGITEITRKATLYHHPKLHNVRIWDLPGIGAVKFPPEQYCEQLNLCYYDFFIIVGSDRYKCVHTTLVKAILAMGKRFYFVRNKTDIDYEACQRRHKLKADTSQMLLDVKQNCLDALKKEGVASPQVFLVSSIDPGQFEFQQLQDSLGKELPSLRKDAFLRSIPALITKIVRRKRRALMGEAWPRAEQICLLSIEESSAKAASLLVATLSSFCTELGLQEESLKQTAEKVGKPVPELEANIKSPLVKSINPEEILKLVAESQSLASKVLNYIPYWGSSSTVTVSFTATYRLIKDSIKDLSEDAERVLKRALDCEN